MGRGLSSAFKSHLESDVLRPAYFVKLSFVDDSVKLWSGNGAIMFGGETYQGVGSLGAISNTEETVKTVAKGVKLTLVGQGSGIYQAAMADSRQMQGRPAFIWIAFMNADFDTVLYSYQLNKYIMDRMTVSDEFGTSDTAGIRIDLFCESELVDMFDPSTAYYSDRDQKALYPGDTFFSKIATLPGKDIKWAEKGAVTSNGGFKGRSPVKGGGREGLP